MGFMRFIATKQEVFSLEESSWLEKEDEKMVKIDVARVILIKHELTTISLSILQFVSFNSTSKNFFSKTWI